VDKLNELIAGKLEADMPLEDIVRSTVGDPQNRRRTASSRSLTVS
jgi:hypothetical protein